MVSCVQNTAPLNRYDEVGNYMRACAHVTSRCALPALVRGIQITRETDFCCTRNTNMLAVRDRVGDA